MAQKLIYFIVSVFFFMTINFTVAAVTPPHSENYLIIADSINFVGGLLTSSSYQLQSTGGEVGTGTSTSASYNLRAGYQAMDSSEVLFVEVPNSSQSLSPSIDVQAGGQSDLALTWLVTSTNGYTFTVTGSDLSATETVPEYYTDATVGWSVSNGASAYGFSPTSNDLVNAYKNDGVSCGSGATISDCWRGFNNVSDLPLTEHLIAEKNSASAQRSVVLNLRAEIAANSFLSQTMTGNIYATIVSQ